MTLKSIEQRPHEKVEIYYECIFKLVNSLQDKAKDSLLVTFQLVCNPTYMSPQHWPNVTTSSNKKKLMSIVKKTWAMSKIIGKSWNLPTN
jgi:hypothetical protein